MSFRFWLFVAGISAAAAVLAGAYGAHALATLAALDKEIYQTGQLYHLLHSMALFGVAGLMAATDGRRNALATWLTQIAAIAFVVGMLLFSGGIYFHILMGVKANAPLVPAGGMSLTLGWTALALSAFGFRRSA